MLKPTPSKPGLFSVAFKRLCALKGIAVACSIALVFTVLYLSLATPLTAQAATNNTINFQARLESASGAIVADGNYDVEFKLYSVSSAGTAEWTEDYTYNSGPGATDARIHVASGYLTVNLGSITSFPNTINWDQQQWLTMNIGGTVSSGTITWDGEMNPRLQLTAVPYALRAGQLATGNGTLQSTLSITQPTVGNQTFVIPDMAAAGTYTLLTTSTGIQLQSSTPGSAQTGNFNISGTGLLGTLDATGTTLNVGTVNATTLNVGNGSYAKTINIGDNASAGVSTITIGSTYNAGNTVTIKGGTGSSAVIIRAADGGTITLGDNASAYTQNINIGSNATASSTSNVTIGSTIAGTVTVQGSGIVQTVSGNGEIVKTTAAGTDNTTALQVENHSGTAVLDVDTANGRVGIDGGSPSASLQVKNVSSNTTILDLQTSGSFDALTVADTSKVAFGKAPAALLGNGSIGTQGGSDYGLITGQKFTTSPTGAGSLTSMSVYIHTGVSASPNNLGQLAIYADTTSGCALSATDCPSTLVASSAQTALTGSSWNTMSISATVAANTTYWLVFWENDPTLSDEALVSPTNAGTPFVFANATFAGSMPSTFPALTFDNTSYDASIYATYASSAPQLTADPTANNIDLGYNTGLILQGSTAVISNSQGFTGSEAVGVGASVSDSHATALGDSTTSAYQGVAVGYSASAVTAGTAIGYGAYTTGTGAVALGYGANANTNGTALGVNASAWADSIALGTDATTTANHQLVIGNSYANNFYIQDAYIGSGVTDSTPQNATLHATGGSGSNVVGANLNFAGGIGTGTGNGGGINFQIAKPSGTSGSNSNALSTVMSISGANGGILLQNATDNTTAFQIQNVASNPIFTVDTAGTHILVGSTSTCTGIANYGKLCVAQGVTGGSGGTSTNSMSYSTVSVTAAQTVIGQRIRIDDTSAAIANTLQGVYVDMSNTTNTTATITSIQATAPAANAGNLLDLQSCSGSSCGTVKDVVTVSNTGAVNLKNQTNSTTAFQVQNSGGGTPVFNVDTSNNRVGIGTAAPGASLDVQSTSTTTNAVNVTANSLTTGNGVNVSTTAATQSAGSLVNVSDTATLNTGGSSMSGNLVNVSRSLTSNVTPTSTNVGYTSIGGSTDSADGNSMEAFKVTSSATGTITTLKAYIASPIDATNNVAQMAIYSNSGTAPGGLLASSADTTLTGNAWNTFTISSVSVTSGTVYWLAYNTKTSLAADNDFKYTVGGGTSIFVSQTYGTWPSTWSGGTAATDEPSFYGIITGSSAESVTGAVATFSNNCTQTAGTCTDASSVLSLNQQYASATGSVFSIQNSGSGDMLDLANGSGTVLFNVTSSGSVGIGTSTPHVQLEVAGGVYLGTQVLTANDQADVCLFTNSNCSAGQSGAFNNKLKIFGGSSQTRNIFLYQAASGDAYLGSSFADLVIETTSNNANILLEPNGTGQVVSSTIYAFNPSSPGTAETWHKCSIPSGWTDNSTTGTDGFEYRLLPDGDVEMSVNLIAPSGTGGVHGTTECTLPSGYYDSTNTQNVVLTSSIATAPDGQAPHFNIGTTGAVKAFGIAGSSPVISGSAVYPTNQ